MTSRTRRIVWSPLAGQNQFIIGSTDLRLYEWSRRSRDEDPTITMLAVNTDVNLMKCFAWSPSKTVQDLVAVGLTNGRTVLLRMQNSMLMDSSPENMPLMGELVPRNARACNVVSFSSLDTNLLATGLDKVRNDFSLLVWDITQHQAASSMGESKDMDSTMNSSGGGMSAHRPLQQYGSSEAITSVTWFPKQQGLLGAGMGLKWIRLYDIRVENNSPALVNATKSIYGMHVDPFHEYRFASFSDEGVICLWDMRKFNEPVLNMPTDSSNGLTRIAYDPFKPGILAYLPRESLSLQVWHLENGPVMTSKDEPNMASFGNSSTGLSGGQSFNSLSQESIDKTPVLPWMSSASVDVEMSILWKSRQCTPKKTLVMEGGSDSANTQSLSSSLASFSWIPTEKDMLLTVSRSGFIDNIHLKSPPLYTFDLNGHLTSTEDLEITSSQRSPIEVEEQHIFPEAKMRYLAKNGYGMNIEHNLNVLSNHLPKRNRKVWEYLEIIENIMKDKNELASYGDLIYQSLIRIFTESSLISNIKKKQNLEIKKDYVYKICNWNYGNNMEKAIDEFEAEGKWEKAAAFSIFNSDPVRAIKLLNSSNDKRLKLVAVALAGYNPDMENQAKTFLEICSSLITEMDDPYMRAIFAYISSRGSLEPIFNDDDLPMKERIVLAISFLPLNNIIEFAKMFTTKYSSRGDLEAILFTGLNAPFCIELLQTYLDMTGDIQTVALVSSFASKKSFSVSHETRLTVVNSAQKLQEWIESYRELLNKWEMYDERCHFDIDRRKRFMRQNDNAMILESTPASPTSPGQSFESTFNSIYEVPPQIYVRCNFCNQSIAHNNIILPGMGMVGIASTSSIANANSQFFSSPNRGTTVRMMRESSGYSTPGALNQTPSQQQQQHQLNSALQNIKKIACPTCKKPLPRCAICLLHIDSNVSVLSGDSNESSPVDWWFTWCQKCRHGGHAIHMSEWFERHSVCPVSNCDCHCSIG